MLQRLRKDRGHRDEPVSGENVRLIVGLGNPGKRYLGNRHNAGFMAVDWFARSLPAGTQRARFQAEYLETRCDDARIVLAKPVTYMNNSGEAVAQLVRWYKIERANMLVVYDELDLPFQTIRLRAHGSDGGHNGVASIIHHLGTDQFPRLRIGVGRPIRGSTVQYVLADFSSAERSELPGIFDRTNHAIRDWIESGIDAAMNLHNRRPSDTEG